MDTLERDGSSAQILPAKVLILKAKINEPYGTNNFVLQLPIIITFIINFSVGNVSLSQILSAKSGVLGF